MAEIEAIVYESNTGFTEEYAKRLSKKISLPAFPIIDGERKEQEKDENESKTNDKIIEEHKEQEKDENECKTNDKIIEEPKQQEKDENERKTIGKIFKERKPVIFLGWVCAGKINGLRMARLKYNPMIIAAVGMMPMSDKYAFRLAMENNIDVPFYYLQGGVNLKKLKGFYKMMFKLVSRPIQQKAEKDMSQLTAEEQILVPIIKNGGSFVCDENLEELKNKYEEIKSILAPKNVAKKK